MGRRGPKPVNVNLLKVCATEWALRLYELRDGRPAELYRVKHSVRLEKDGTCIPLTKYICVGKFHPESEDARRLLIMLPPRVGDAEWSVVRPVDADSETWREFQSARSGETYQALLARIEARLPEGERSSEMWSKLFRAARERAADLVKARKLAHYPRAKNIDRPTSDNKRIEFFAKVLAGLALGLAPATATKRLARWSPPTPETSIPLGPFWGESGL